MAEWKKVIVSGSNISQLANDSSYAVTTAISGAFTATSAAIATDIADIVAAGYDLDIAGDSGTGVVVNAETLTIAGGTNITTAWTDGTSTMDVNLDANISLTSVTASLKGNVDGNATGNAGTATKLQTARTIGGVSFDGSANIDLPGVNTTGNQDTSGTAASASVLATARSFTTTGDVVLASANFDGSANFTTTATIQAGAVENTMFAANAKTAISGANTAVSAAIASDIAALTAATYDLDVAADSGTGNITNAETFTFTGGNAITTTMSGNELTIAGAAGLVSASDFTSPSQGTVRATINGKNVDVDTGLQTGDSPTFASLTLTGDLTVQGSTTSLQTQNVNVEDQFILVNSGSAAADGGLVVNGAGTSFGWDQTAGRWAFDYTGATWDQAAITSDAYAAAVVTSDDANYRKNGNIRVQGGEIYIYIE